MTARRRPAALACATLAGLLLGEAALESAGARESARLDVPGDGGVTGLELGIEGTLHATPGGRLRWFVTVYEIRAGRDLQPAPAAALRVLASFQPSKPLLETSADANGRAALSLDVPADLERAFQLVVEVRSPRRVQRQFEVTVQVGQRFRTELHVSRRTVEPGARFHVWGRVLDQARGRPAPGHALTVRVLGRDRRLIGRVLATRTDRQGLFHVAPRSPTLAESFSVEAAAAGADLVRVEGLNAALPSRPSLVVLARPRRAVVRPGSLEEVDVVVRTPEGRPVPRATLTGLSIPEPGKGKARRNVKPTFTDSQGRARVPWRVVSTAPVAEVSGRLNAVREGLGAGSTTVQVRATRRAHLLTWAVEGGAIVPGLPGRVFVRAFHPDGRPLAGAAVRLEGSRIAASPAAVTDAEGVAVLEAKIAPSGREDACSGPTMAAVTVHVGSASDELCLPIDPDATLRVRPRSPAAVSGQPVEVELERVRAVAASPVVVTLLARAAHHRGWQPVAQAVAPPHARRLTLRSSPEAVGLLWVRARPLVGVARQEVRGGGTLIWSAPAPSMELRVKTTAGGRLGLGLHGADQASAFAMALPIEQGEQLLKALRGSHGQQPEPGGGLSRLAGFLAAHTPVDHAAASVLHHGKVLPVAMPAGPAELGLLRDPWRSRARFVRGRLGRLLRAIENHVAASIPEGLHQVAFRGPGGWRFNRELLAGVAGELGPESLSGLDGSPLSIEALQRMDPAFVYDNVARRITRTRLLYLLVALRAFVRQERLDHAWPRRGDPTTWLKGLPDWKDSDSEIEVERSQLFDGWGNPFVLRRAPGGRARFRHLEPVVGYELVSAGPDGKVGTGDDLYDPFARVLRPGGVYAEAVGEDALLARLHGGELGRATIEALAKVFEIEEGGGGDQATGAAGAVPWDSVPRPLEPPGEDELRIHQADGSWPDAAVFTGLGQRPAGVTLPLPPEPRRYLVVAAAYSTDGVTAFAATPLRAGAPVLLDARLPVRLRPGERLDVPIRLTSLRDGQRLSLKVTSHGPLQASLPASQATPPSAAGQTLAIPLRISALSSAAGVGRVRLQVREGTSGVLREVERSIRVMGEGSLRAQHTGALVQGRTTLSLQLPPDAREVRTMLVVSGPRDLLRDPGLRETRRVHPALLGWAHALRGLPSPASLLDALAAERGGAASTKALENACAAVAWSAASADLETRPELEQALARLRSALPSSPRLRGALLVALAAGAPGLSPGGAEAVDPMTALMSELREDAWNALQTQRGQPGVMARLSAGLLLLDRRDAAGRQLFQAARAALVRSPRGGRVLEGVAGQTRDDWIATVALAIAARQLGEHGLAFQLASGIAPRLYLGMSDVEGAFWLLAASVYGALGIASPAAVEVETGGARPPRRLLLRGGVAVLELGAADRATVTSHGQPVLARLEASYLRPVVHSSAAPLSPRLEGDVGHVGETAALELTVESTSASATASRPVLEVLLPSAAELTEDGRRSMERAPAVRRVEPPDLQGLVRVHLEPLGPRQELRLPLPVRWVAGGRFRGFSLAVYDSEQPWRISSRPPRTLVLKPRPEEVWR